MSQKLYVLQASFLHTAEQFSTAYRVEISRLDTCVSASITQTAVRRYLVMEFVNGGTLYFWMRKMGLFTEPQAKFFAAELLLALEHLHTHNIVSIAAQPLYYLETVLDVLVLL